MSCYSLDLRKRVIKFTEECKSISQASRIFKISRPTIYDWIKRNKLNTLEPNNNFNRRYKKINPKILEEYINKHPESTLEEIGFYFKVSHNAIFKRIKKADITYKKKNSFIKKETKKEEKNTLEKQLIKYQKKTSSS